MIGLYLLNSDATSTALGEASKFVDSHDYLKDRAVLVTTRRSALLPYVDPVVSLASRILFLFYHILRPTSQSCQLSVPLAERVSFSATGPVPSSALVEVEAGQTIQIYELQLILTAQLSGLRYLMFHYRLPTFIVFTLLFWASELFFMSAAWISLSLYLDSSSKQDTESQVQPSRGPKKYLQGDDNFVKSSDGSPSTRRIKEEVRVKEEEEQRLLRELPVAGTEADDEDDDDGTPEFSDSRALDSGLGTSYSEGSKDSLRRRSSRGFR